MFYLKKYPSKYVRIERTKNEKNQLFSFKTRKKNESELTSNKIRRDQAGSKFDDSITN